MSDEADRRDEQFKKFLFVLRRALKMLVKWIEEEYGITDKP